LKSVPLFLLAAALVILCVSQADAQLPIGIKAVWDLEKAYREKTTTRERVCLNGLWRWQPAKDVADVAPNDKWGYFKVPGSWPGITDYMQKDSQTVHAHPSWKDESLRSITTAWYQREITIPGELVGRRIAVNVEYLNSYAVVRALLNFVISRRVSDEKS
jgi:beta-galactosidase